MLSSKPSEHREERVFQQQLVRVYDGDEHKRGFPLSFTIVLAYSQIVARHNNVGRVYDKGNYLLFGVDIANILYVMYMHAGAVVCDKYKRKIYYFF